MKTFFQTNLVGGKEFSQKLSLFFHSRFSFGLIWDHIFVVAMEYGGNIYWKMRNDGKTVNNA